MDLRQNDHRRRLLQAMAASVASKGYAAVTIADLAAEARVSKRSFYEQFRDKAECFIALYEQLSLEAIQALQDAFDPTRDWHGQVDQVLAAYFGKLSRSPALLNTLFVDVMVIGPLGLAARRRTCERVAEFITAASKHQISREDSVAIMAGMHEWVLQALEQQRLDQIAGLAAPGAKLIRAVIARGPHPQAEPATA